jgi:hypothetical protein
MQLLLLFAELDYVLSCSLLRPASARLMLPTGMLSGVE